MFHYRLYLSHLLCKCEYVPASYSECKQNVGYKVNNIKCCKCSSYSYVCFQECLIEMLQEMFGEDSVPKIFKGEKLYVTVDGKKANIDLLNLVSAMLVYVCVILSMLCDTLCKT